MGRAEIPVDLHNPGQVFACLGFLEAADILCGPAEGGFDWSSDERFILEAGDTENPVEVVLGFLAATSVRRLVPFGWVAPPTKSTKKKVTNDQGEADEDIDASEIVHQFPARKGEAMALPIRIVGGNLPTVLLGHWADSSGRNPFKLYAGNRSAAKIATDMLRLIHELWAKDRETLIKRPLEETCPMGGSFNFDPRGAWTAIDAGYSPDKHKVKGASVFASPVVEFMAAWGLEHARPDEFDTRKVRYAVWPTMLTPLLARVALSGHLTSVACRHYRFTLALSGKNKVVSFSQEETPSHD